MFLRKTFLSVKKVNLSKKRVAKCRLFFFGTIYLLSIIELLEMYIYRKRSHMEDNNSEIINGANPSVIWSQYMDFLYTYGKQMKSQYTKRMRENNPFTWTELDIMNKDIHEKLDKLVCSNY